MCRLWTTCWVRAPLTPSVMSTNLLLFTWNMVTLLARPPTTRVVRWTSRLFILRFRALPARPRLPRLLKTKVRDTLLGRVWRHLVKFWWPLILASRLAVLRCLRDWKALWPCSTTVRNRASADNRRFVDPKVSVDGPTILANFRDPLDRARRFDMRWWMLGTRGANFGPLWTKSRVLLTTVTRPALNPVQSGCREPTGTRRIARVTGRKLLRRYLQAVSI